MTSASTGPVEELRRSWTATTRDAGLDPAVSSSAFDDLLGRYRSPGRAYHGVAHLASVLRTLEELTDGTPSAEVRLAAWYHDAVQGRGAGEDEAASARLAQEQLVAAGLDHGRARRVGQMVEATAGHLVDAGRDVAVDPDTAVLLDADLAILGADHDEYDRYTASVRQEYPHLDDTTFARGRAGVVRRLLDRPSLYLTEEARRRFDDRARTNLRRELARLTTP